MYIDAIATKTEQCFRIHPPAKNHPDEILIALDIGYSGVKGMGPQSYYCFPSFARRIESAPLQSKETDILLETKDGKLWAVGTLAQETIALNDTNDSLNTLYGRDRYSSDIFKIISLAGLGLGVYKFKKHKAPDTINQKVYLQTGLPPEYVRADTGKLKSVLSGKHQFRMKYGLTKEWQEFDIDLKADNIGVVGQPMGGLFAASKDIYGRAKHDLITKNVLVFDAGFGTLDVVLVQNRNVAVKNTFDDFGMKEVLSRTSDRIFRQYGEEISVHAMQKVLLDGRITCYDPIKMKSNFVCINDLVLEILQDVCMAALKKINSVYQMQYINYLLLTGGTSEAWREWIVDYYKGMESLQILSASCTDDIPAIYSNVAGYYRFGMLRR